MGVPRHTGMAPAGEHWGNNAPGAATSDGVSQNRVEARTRRQLGSYRLVDTGVCLYSTVQQLIVCLYRSVAVEISSDSLVLKGTIGDFAVRLKNDTTFSFVTSILEVKKNVSDGDQFQAGVELVGMETLLRRMVPVFLTDLKNDWRLIFRDSLFAIRVMILTRDQAVNMMQQLVATFALPVGSSQARFSVPPFSGFLMEPPKKRTAGEAQDRLEDELSVMQMSGCPYNEIRDFLFSRGTFGGIAVDNGEWRNMYA